MPNFPHSEAPLGCLGKVECAGAPQNGPDNSTGESRIEFRGEKVASNLSLMTHYGSNTIGV